MSFQNILFILLVFALSACDQTNSTNSDGKKSIDDTVKNAEEIIDSNVKSIEENYRQQDLDTLPPKRED